MVRILLLLIVLGLVWWLTTFLPLPEPFPTLIKVVVILCMIWEVLALLGYVSSLIDRRSPPPP